MASPVSARNSRTVIDLEDQGSDMARDHTPEFKVPSPLVVQRSEGEVSNFIDLTSDFDNPCFDPSESNTAERSQRATTRRHPPPEDVTWDTLYPQLPETLQHHLDAHRPAPQSNEPRRKQVNTRKGKGKEKEEVEEFHDDFDMEDEKLLIELTDHVAAQASGSSRNPTTANEGESKFGLCPFCESGRRVLTPKRTDGPKGKRQMFRCSDPDCWYTELLEEEN